SFANADASGNASGSYTRSGPGPGTVDVNANLTRADASRIARYLPHAHLKGDLRDFPFVDPARGQFLITARFENGVLRYDDQWPRIENIEGDLQFERDGMLIIGRSGTILGARVGSARVSIAELDSPSKRLLISGQASGASAEFLRFIAESPLRRKLEGVSDNLRVSGSGALRLKIDMPLNELPATTVAGDFQFSGNTITVAQLPSIERAAGGFGFSDSGFSVHRVSGRLFGAPIEISGGTRAGGAVEIVAQGRNLRLADLRLERPWRDTLSGAASYTATLSIREGNPRLRVESSLRGVASSLPAPLAKSAAEVLPLRVEVAQSDGGVRDRVSATLGRLAAAEVLRRRQGAAMVMQR